MSIKKSKTRIPADDDQAHDGDTVLAKFQARHGLDPDTDDEAPNWGDTEQLPLAVLRLEQVGVAERLLAKLREAGVKVAEQCRARAGTHAMDYETGDQDRLRATIAARMRTLTPAQRQDMAALCYRSPKKQQWLLGLAS